MPLPTGKEIFVQGVVVDPAQITSRERDLLKKRKYYWKNREKLIEREREKYKAAIEAGGEVVRRPGRPRKYPAETYV